MEIFGPILLLVLIIVALRLLVPEPGGTFYLGGVGFKKIPKEKNDELAHRIAKEARASRHSQQRRQRMNEALPPETVDEHTDMQRKIGAEIDRIASQPGGVLQFDLNGDGAVDNEEMKIARERVADRIRPIENSETDKKGSW